MDNETEEQGQVHNQGSVQGQNIAHHQHITQHFHEMTSRKQLQQHTEGIVFAHIMLDKRNPYWHAIDDLTCEEVGKPFPPTITNALIPDPYHRLYKQHFHANMLPPDPNRVQTQIAQLPKELQAGAQHLHTLGIVKEKADPSFDVTLLNSIMQSIILTAVGIEVLSAAHVFSLPGGGPRAYIVPMDAEYTVDIPNMEDVVNMRKLSHLADSHHCYIPPIQLNRILSFELPAPIYVPPRATFRYTLHLAHYQEHLLNSTLLRLWIRTHEGQERSHNLYLSFGDIWWKRDAIKEIGKPEQQLTEAGSE